MWQTLITLWLTLSCQTPRRPAPRRRPAFRRSASRPRLELLEDRLAPATLLPLASFGPYANGASPQGGMVEDSHGNLFGTTYSGGTYGAGTVFELAAGSGAITTLASFNGSNGSGPTGDLVMDSQGNLYGTTYQGGTPNGQNGQQNVQGNRGTVFELANGSNTITDLVSFYYYYNGPYYNGPGEEGYPLGAGPLSGLFEDSQGNLFGTTTGGGEDSSGNSLGEGTLFEIANGTHAFSTRATFTTTSLSGTENGIEPAAPPIEDSYGNLFGTTTGGGESDAGTVYEVTASGSLITLADFTGPNGANGPDGQNDATGRLVMDSHGNLFGTTHAGGSTWNGSQTSGYGTVFEINANYTITTSSSTVFLPPWEKFGLVDGSAAITTLASFDATTNGYLPEGGLVMDGHGNLFGATAGGDGYGTVFEVANGTNTITTLASFNSTNGALPIGDLIMDGNGNLFGVTIGGGATGSGAVFEVETGISPFGDVSLQAPDVTASNAATENPYTFSLAFHDETLVNYQSVLAATIQVQPPTGPALTAQLQGIVASNADASGNSANLTAVYQITPPGGSWSAAPAGTYSVVLSGSPVTDLAGYAAPLGAVGSFTSATSVAAVAVEWGSETATLQTAADGIRLLPAGRNTDLPWFNINRIAITLGQAAAVNPGDVSVTGISGGNYGPVTVSGSGTTTIVLTLAKPVSGPDRVTVTIGNAQVITYTRRLDILPGDVNDDGAVNTTDGVLILTHETPAHAYQAIYDMNGDGTVTAADFILYRPAIGTTLPSLPPQLAAGGEGPGAASQLTPNEVSPVLAAAIQEWAAAGLPAQDVARLEGVTVQITNLPSGYLGTTAIGGDVIYLSADAAGYGWFIDAAPWTDGPFAPPTVATGQEDLLTVLMHELGHTLGLGDLNPSAFSADLMAETLAAGVRRLPSALDVAAAMATQPAAGREAPLTTPTLPTSTTAADAVFAGAGRIASRVPPAPAFSAVATAPDFLSDLAVAVLSPPAPVVAAPADAGVPSKLGALPTTRAGRPVADTAPTGQTHRPASLAFAIDFNDGEAGARSDPWNDAFAKNDL